MRPGNTPRPRLKLGNNPAKGQLAVYLCAALLGIAVAYAVLRTASPSSKAEGAAAGGGGEAYSARSGAAAARALNTQQQGQDSKVVSSAEEDKWYNKLDGQGCKATEELRMCSHRAKSLELSDVFPGSLSAYEALWKAKIKCFDIDLVATADGQLLASHPADLQAALPVAKWGQLADTIGRHTLEAIRQAGADEERYPTVISVLQVLARLLESEEDKFWLKEGSQLDYARLPIIFLDLKGPAFTEAAVRLIGSTAEELHIAPHVALFVMKHGQEALVAQAGYRGPLIRGYLDQENPNPALSAEGLARYAMLGPSVQMADAFFKRAAELEKPIHVWTVDTPAALYRGLEMGVDSVISNRPLALRQVLFDWRDRCSDQL